MTRTVEADYLVVGAGAMGMAFTDALIDHADVRVAMVDRRHGVGGHWLEAYPFVRLHQASAFYGVASTLLGGGRVQQHGPEAGLQERADQSEICAYYGRVLADRMLESGKVEFFANCEYVGDRTIVSRISGERFEVPERAGSSTPATSPPTSRRTRRRRSRSPTDARVIPVNDLARLDEAPSQYVIVGSGKTATDACVWLLGRGVDPDAICWVRPRDPWMLNRAVIQPDPAVFLGMVADTMQAAAAAASLEDLFLRLEDAGIMLRIDRSVTPTMAKTPTLATWELEQLRTHRARRTTRARPARRPGDDHLRGRVGRDRERRARRALRGGRPEVPTARPGLAAVRRSRCSRSEPGSPASARHSSATSRRLARTTRRRTGCARRRRTATRWPSGRR